MLIGRGGRLREFDDELALWEPPAIRRIDTRDAEGGGFQNDDGNCVGVGAPGQHSCKRFGAPG
jgi:hypothetical protein